MSDDQQSYQPYAPASSRRPPATVYVSDFFADDDAEREELTTLVRTRLEEAERLLCVVSVIKVSPSLSMLVLTDRRVLAGWRDDLGTPHFTWKVELAGTDVQRLEITGFMDNVKFVRHDDEVTKVGNLREAADIPSLREAVARTLAGAEAPAAQEPRDGAPPTWDVYPG